MRKVLVKAELGEVEQVVPEAGVIPEAEGVLGGEGMLGGEGNRKVHMEEEGMEGIEGVGNLLRKSNLQKMLPIMSSNWW